MANHDAPFLLAYFGDPHSGKTTDLERFIERCHRDTIFVYNRGYRKDWVGYEEIKIWGEKKTKTLYFTHRGKDYEFEKYFYKKFKGKRVKAGACRLQFEEDMLFLSLGELPEQGSREEQAKNRMLFVLEDSVSILSANLKRVHKNLFYRLKHAGVWTAIVGHLPNLYPVNAFMPITHVRFFKMSVPPPTSKHEKIPHFDKYVAAYKTLVKAPKYTCCLLETETGKLTKIPNKKTKKNK